MPSRTRKVNRYLKLYFRCILKKFTYRFLKNFSRSNFKNESLLLTNGSLYFFIFHLKFSSLFTSSQLTDILSYEVPRFIMEKRENSVYTDQPNFEPFEPSMRSHPTTSIVVYNFHNLYNQERFYVFTHLFSTSIAYPFSRFNTLNNKITSIADLFCAANWLEREVSELHNVTFSSKKDLRNLLLQYGDSTAPFRKAFPSIGLREFFYNPVKDSIVQNPISIQL